MTTQAPTNAQPAAASSSVNKVTNFVGKVVNGFEIQKLIGKPSRQLTDTATANFPNHSSLRPRKVLLRLPRQARK